MADQKQQILAVHVQDMDGMCAGCRAWWSYLTPYPCSQMQWATMAPVRAAGTRLRPVGSSRHAAVGSGSYPQGWRWL